MKKYLFLLGILISGLFTACQTEDWNDGETPVNGAANGFTLSYKVGDVVSAKTRAAVPIEDGEDTINSLYILFFEYTTNGSGEFIEVLDAMEDYNASQGGNSGVLTINFPVDSKLNKSTNYNLLICANIEDYITFTMSGVSDLQAYCEGMSEEQVGRILLKVSGVDPNPNEQDDNSNLLPINNIPMSATAVKAGSESTVAIELRRVVSRFDVSCQAAGYTLVSASVWNAYPSAYLWENEAEDFSLPRTERYYGVEPNRNGDIVATLYAFENVVDAPTQEDKQTTCVIVGLVKDGNTAVEYFRVNINATYMGQSLLRNNVYRTAITRVGSQGANCERDAYESKEFFLEYDINGWTLDDSGNIHYDGDNILAVPVKVIDLFPQGEVREYSIFTLGDETLEISQKELPSNITVELKKNLLVVTATESDSNREGFIELSYGPKLKATIKITQGTYINDYVDLSTYTLPFFSRGTGEMSQQILVNSSAEWTAEIFNGTYFSFAAGPQQKSVITGQSGQGFNVFTIKENETTEPRYSFVVIKLVDKPEITRVLVLGQSGTGGLSVSPAERTVQFDAMGNALTNTVFAVSAFEENNGVELAWEVVKVSGDNGFEIVPDPYQSHKFSITASFNSLDKPLNAIYRVRLVDEPQNYTEIQVTQACHTLTVNPSTFPAISFMGGSTQNITVSSSSSWTAEMSVKNGTAYFNETEGLQTITGNNGTTFKVTFPKLTTPKVNPVATVTLTLDGTDVKQTFTVSQSALSTKVLTVMTRNNTYGSLYSIGSAHTYRFVYNLATNMRDTKVVGPNGTVYMSGNYNFVQKDKTPDESVNIYQTAMHSPTENQFKEIKTWMEKDDSRLLFLCQDLEASEAMTRYQKVFGKSGYTVKTVNAAAKHPRMIYSGLDMSNKLLSYLLKDGPFTNGVEVDADRIVLYAKDGTNRGLQSWPSTFIPLIMSGNKNAQTRCGIEDGSCCVFGIDPVNRLIFLGDVDIFGSSTKSDNNFVNFDSNHPENVKFLNNLIAWMTNAALYGEEFLKDFY